MIKISNLSYRFTDGTKPLFEGVNLEIALGELCLVVGPTGSGKSTFLKALNGLNPFFTGGVLGGEISLENVALTGKRPQQLSHLVAYVEQQAESSFVAETVAEEIAFALEQLGIPASEMIRRVLAIARELDVVHLMHRRVQELSGGQQQRVAIAAALVAGAQVLVLDEPTSELDSEASHKLLALLRTLTKKRGLTVIMAEHRIDRLLGIADSAVLISGDGRVKQFSPEDAAENLVAGGRIGSPLIDLARTMEWRPVPLTIEAARERWRAGPGKCVAPHSANDFGKTLLTATNLTAEIAGRRVLTVPNLKLRGGRITGVIGPNGAGKSSLLWRLVGGLRGRGEVKFEDGSNPVKMNARDLLAHVALVPQAASDLLVLQSVGAELAASDSFAGVAEGTSAGLLAELIGDFDASRHPRDLSAGQQLALALAIQLAKGARILLLDEPTRGLDYSAKAVLREVLMRLAATGKSIVVATHDVEFLASIADECIHLVDGAVRDQGPAAAVLAKLGPDAPIAWQVTHSALTGAEVTK